MKKKCFFLKAKPLHIETGGINIAVFNIESAKDLDIKHMDRVLIKNGSKKVICSVDLSHIVKKNEIGLFVEPYHKLGLKKISKVCVEPIHKPMSLDAIKSKLNGEELNKEELFSIVRDIVDDALTSTELTAFIVSSYTRGMSLEEVYNFSNAMVKTGEVLKVGKGPVFDKHSIGGVPANRVTMIMIPILSSVGIKIPKTSSRAITSPSGTADTMEVFAPVTLSKRKIEGIVKRIGGCMVWGGSFNLAPADDKIIIAEKTLSLDAEGSMLASILAKKLSAGATHVVIDIPMGPGTKVPTHERADNLIEKFTRLGEKMGMKIYCIVSNGSQPCGNGIGPVLESRDVLKILKNDKTAPKDLREKSLLFAGRALELAGKAKQGRGLKKARSILESGKAYEQFKKIVKAQGGNPSVTVNDLHAGKFVFDVIAKKSGIITMINNKSIASIARAAGSPYNKGAGIFITAKLSDFIKTGDFLMRIHSESKLKLERAKKVLKEKQVFTIQ